MRPGKRAVAMDIPITFDSHSKPSGLGNDRFIMAILFFGVWLFTAIVSLFTELEIGNKILYVLGSGTLSMLIIRFVIMKEYYFQKKRTELAEKNFQFDLSTIWGIYEVGNAYPYICRYGNGLKAVFVKFEKDVIVGREEDNDYYHWEAIADAYAEMSKRKMDCMHIDYMDSVGKDDRVLSLFEMAKKAQNPILKEVLTRLFDYVQAVMQKSYASYDVYCFYYAGKDELFVDELELVINAFLNANYVRFKVLDKESIGELVKSLFNLETFSVNAASERLFSFMGGIRYLTPIWVTRDDEKKILNKTREEKEEERKTRRVEKDLRKSKVKKGIFNNEEYKQRESAEIDLFGGTPQDILKEKQEEQYQEEIDIDEEIDLL